jgi:hypothetical protein
VPQRILRGYPVPSVGIGRSPRRLAAPTRTAVRSRAAGLAAVAVLSLPILISGQQPAASWPPAQLRDTGLYSDWDTRTVDPGHLPFSPQYPLWSDGATKRRWLHLPPGTWIDASDPDVWVFPVGTRIWKEFRFSRLAETRFIERTAEGWQFAAYAWSQDEREAPLAPARGVSRSVESRPGVHHAIPSRMDCRACHEASPVRVLGFSALQLSSDRDPNAVHAEPVPDGGVDLETLAERGLVRNLPARQRARPPRIEATSATARAALGYLHANCGSCHVQSGQMATLDFALDYPLRRSAVPAPPALLTSLGRPSKFRVAGDTSPGERVCPTDPDSSVLLVRMRSRNPLLQMPPLGTRLVDEEAVRAIRAWILEEIAARAPLAPRTERMEETR